MKQLFNNINNLMKQPFYRRYDAIHSAMGYMEAKSEILGNKKLFSATEILELLELVALDPEREEEKTS